ncbi:hypothetical protein VNO78_06694 [Psophocarpus tetragonolobus]|uniref:EF-hand domain-containing protein n=1 Tax=Psophocarpus tetragonolobus TaxID=3891 RepID=A0AAN9T2E3_PSOTE
MPLHIPGRVTPTYEVKRFGIDFEEVEKKKEILEKANENNVRLGPTIDIPDFAKRRIHMEKIEQSSNVVEQRNKMLKKENIMRILKEADANEDGWLDKNEIRRALMNLGTVFPAWRASRCLKYAGHNKDGVIDGYDEMEALVKYLISCGYGDLKTTNPVPN